MSPASWHPDASESQLIHEQAWLQGTILSAVAYGTNVALFILNFSLLRARSRSEKEKDRRCSKQTAFLQAYICLMAILCTLSIASQADMTQLGFIDNRRFLGGPAEYEKKMFGATPISAMGIACFSLMNWFVDSLLLWRCYVIYWNSTTSPWLLLAFPGLLLLASFVSGVIFLEGVTDGVSSPFEHISLTLVYGTICLSLNLILTFMIVIRLYLYRTRIKRLVGSRYAGQYTSIASMFIESASIMDVTIILVLITIATGSPLVTLPLLSLAQVQVIASFMIIQRVAKSTAWSSRTANEIITQQMGGTPVENGTLSAARFRITSQMTQTSTAVHFNHLQSMTAYATAMRDKQNQDRNADGMEGACQCADEGESA